MGDAICRGPSAQVLALCKGLFRHGGVPPAQRCSAHQGFSHGRRRSVLIHWAAVNMVPML